jgi:hypothetical protein
MCICKRERERNKEGKREREKRERKGCNNAKRAFKNNIDNRRG